VSRAREPGPGGAAAACALVVLSCDARRDLWGPCLALYRRYWPDCPYPIFLAGETIDAVVPPARPLRGGFGPAWSDVTRTALGALDHEHVLLMLDDFFLTRPVDTAALEARRRQLEAAAGACLRLGPWPGPTAPVPWAGDVGEHEPGRPYRTALQPAFWRRTALLDLLVPGESPRDFERSGSVRADAQGTGIYACRVALLPYVEVVTGGRWYRRGLRLCRREGLPVDPARPPARPLREAARLARRQCRRILSGPRLFRLRRAIRRLVAG
jgi:hypothetical protein